MADAAEYDRSLPLRTLVAAVLGAAVGVALAYALVQVLAAIAVPSFERYIRTVAFDANLKALHRWVADPAAARRSGFIALGVAGAAALVLPFLINRRLIRQLLSLRGLLRLLGGLALVATVEALVLSMTDLFMSTGAAFSDAGNFGLPAGAGVRAWGPLALKVLLGGVGTAALFVIVGERAAERADRADTRGGRVFAAAVGGVVAGALAALLGAWARPRFALLFNLDLLAALGQSVEVTALGWERLRLGLALTLGLLTASSWALLVAFAPSPTQGGRRLGGVLIAALPAAALVIVGLWFQGHCTGVRELRFPSLAAAASLEAAPGPRLLALPGAKAPQVHAYPMTAGAIGATADEKIGATRKNLSLLRGYVERQKTWTAYTGRAWTAQPAIFDRLLEPEEAVRTQIAAAEATGSLLENALLSVRLRRMPLTPAVKPVAERLLDPARFTARGQGKGNLALVALNVGDLPRAQRLWQEALAEGMKPDGNVPAPTALIPTDGSITARVLLSGAPVMGLRVALYTTQSPLESVPLGVRLVAATVTDREGRFAFGGLPRQTYAVGLLLPESLGADPAGVVLGGGLGVIDLKKGPAQADVGTITVDRRGAASAPASAPAATQPGSAPAPASAPAASVPATAR